MKQSRVISFFLGAAVPPAARLSAVAEPLPLACRRLIAPFPSGGRALGNYGVEHIPLNTISSAVGPRNLRFGQGFPDGGGAFLYL